jgi:hypothetical protein
MKKSRLLFLLMAVLFLGACNSSKKCGCPTFKAMGDGVEMPDAQTDDVQMDVLRSI